MITLTEVAAREVKGVFEQQYEAARKNGAEPRDLHLRVGVRGGGCGGFGYSLDLAEEIGEYDESWVHHGVPVICDPRSHLYLDGTTIDFRDEAMGSGFVFNNPNTTTTCGGCASQPG